MGKAAGEPWNFVGLQEVLATHPHLRVIPTADLDWVRLQGELYFDAHLAGTGSVRDVYRIAIDIPLRFPKSLPTVRELAGRVPPDYHTNPDGTLCLGSPVRLHLALATEPTLIGFLNGCIIPFLAGYSYLEQAGQEWTRGLAHGDSGLIDDYMALFGVRSETTCVQMMALAEMKKRVANKHPCPCGSGQRVGRCHHRVLNDLRLCLGRRWWRREHARWELKGRA